MRKCEVASSPECFSAGTIQCRDCMKWFCPDHFTVHCEIAHRRSDTMDATDIRLLETVVVFKDDIAIGTIEMHPQTFCRIAVKLLRENMNGIITQEVKR